MRGLAKRFFPACAAFVLIGTSSGDPLLTSGTALDFSDLTEKTTASSPSGDPNSVTQVRTVEVQGTGTTADEALKDAFSSAVKACIGVMVNAEQVVENEDVIKDDILTYSNGYIKDFDDLVTETREGLIFRRIRATVILGKLATKLREKNIAVNEIKGESLFAEAVTVNQERSDFRAMLRKVLEDYDVKKLWTPRLVERRVVSQTEQEATVEFVISLTPDKAAISAFHQALQKVLATKYQMQRLSLVYDDDSHFGTPRTLEGVLSGGGVTVGTGKRDRFYRLLGDAFKTTDAGVLFVLRAGSRPANEADRRDREVYDLERVYYDISCLYYRIPYVDWQQYFWRNVVFSDGQGNALGGSYNICVASLDLDLRVPYVVGVLKDATGQDLNFFECALDPASIGRAGLGRESDANKDVVCSVMLLHGEGYPPAQYIRLSDMGKLDVQNRPKPLIASKTFKIDELRAIKNIELTIEMRTTGEDGQATRHESGRLSASNAATSPEPLEKQAVRLVQKAMPAGPAALGVDAAISQPRKDSDASY